MCGIVGILGNHEASPILLDALKRLEYRGYDSSGIATINDGVLERRREIGKLVNLADKLVHKPLKGKIGIGHTRWATHGSPTVANAHPQKTGKVAVVHNGIIENFKKLRDELISDGAVFQSETDTETVAQLCMSFINNGDNPAIAAKKTLDRLEGAYALCFLFHDNDNLLIAARKGSPLAIGHGNGEMFVGSDAIALAPGDPNAFAPIVDEAIKSGVPVVFVDTNGINEGVTFIGTNNMNGAELAAKFICDKTPKGSDVAILTGIESQSTALLRRDGAIKGFKNCGLNIVATQTAEWDTAKGRSVTESIILKNPNIKAIFASNDNMGLGAMQALKDADMNDVVVVGFDATPDAATSILKGEMTATIAQFSYNMGAYGVKYALELANGGSIDPNIDTGTQLVTKENANDFK